MKNTAEIEKTLAAFHSIEEPANNILKIWHALEAVGFAPISEAKELNLLIFDPANFIERRKKALLQNQSIALSGGLALSGAKLADFVSLPEEPVQSLKNNQLRAVHQVGFLIAMGRITKKGLFELDPAKWEEFEASQTIAPSTKAGKQRLAALQELQKAFNTAFAAGISPDQIGRPFSWAFRLEAGIAQLRFEFAKGITEE